jgi:large subunit ribosomal protein L4
MKANLFDINGTPHGTIDLRATHFGIIPNSSLVHKLLLLQQANGRIAIAHAKHRGEVAGSTRKLFKQKGTGNARMGDRRSPMRRGGGAVFGPRSERNFSFSMNKTERRTALLSLLSDKAANQNIQVIESFDEQTSKTKFASQLFHSIEATHSVLAVTRDEMPLVAGARNLPGVRLIHVEYLNPHDILKYTRLVLSQKSLEKLYSHFV